MRQSRSRLLFQLIAGFLLLHALPAFAQTGIPTDSVTRESLKFARIFQAVEKHYMSPVDPDKSVLEGAVRGMLVALDPFSSFFNASQFKTLQEETRGKMLGFGSILYVQPGRATVIQTQQGSPSWRAGLGPGDLILGVNGIGLAGLDLRQLIYVFQRARNHPVRLRVLRPGEEAAQNIVMDPAEVNRPTVNLSFLEPNGIGYVQVSSFESQTVTELADAIKKLGPSRLKGLILDLRNNPGGLLASAVGVSSLFLKPGSVVLTVEGRVVPPKTYRTVSVPLHVSVPLIVLVNRWTASAAEVVTAALQDHDRALIVGEPTFGKGVVESVMPLSDHTGLALLTAEYFAPSGRCIQRPLRGTALQNPEIGIRATSLKPVNSRDPVFRTDDGRPVLAEGGITPDVRAIGWKRDPWLNFLNGTGAFTTFATQYVNLHQPISRSFEPDPETLKLFRDFLAGQGVRSPGKYWLRDENYLKMRIRAEIFTLIFGLNYGNQVTAESDPQVQKAISLFPEVSRLLKGPSEKSPAGAYRSSAAR